jgi:biopolymer transport protein ExbB
VAEKNKENAMQMLRNKRWIFTAVALAALSFSLKAVAEEGGEGGGSSGFVTMLRNAGFMFYILLVVSITGFALAFQAMMQIRLHLMRPPELANELVTCVQEGNIDAAVETAQADSSFLGAVAFATLSNAQYGKEGMETAMSDVGEIEANKFLNKLGILNLIAAISPMLGLTGTTVGMIITFATIASKADAVTTSDMAKGIGEALICTFAGLMVAIPLLIISFFLKSRVQQVVLEIANDCNELIRVVSSGEHSAA